MEQVQENDITLPIAGEQSLHLLKHLLSPILLDESELKKNAALKRVSYLLIEAAWHQCQEPTRKSPRGRVKSFQLKFYTAPPVLGEWSIQNSKIFYKYGGSAEKGEEIRNALIAYISGRRERTNGDADRQLFQLWREFRIAIAQNKNMLWRRINATVTFIEKELCVKLSREQIASNIRSICDCSRDTNLPLRFLTYIPADSVKSADFTHKNTTPVTWAVERIKAVKNRLMANDGYKYWIEDAPSIISIDAEMSEDDNRSLLDKIPDGSANVEERVETSALAREVIGKIIDNEIEVHVTKHKLQELSSLVFDVVAQEENGWSIFEEVVSALETKLTPSERSRWRRERDMWLKEFKLKFLRFHRDLFHETDTDVDVDTAVLRIAI